MEWCSDISFLRIIIVRWQHKSSNLINISPMGQLYHTESSVDKEQRRIILISFELDEQFKSTLSKPVILFLCKTTGCFSVQNSCSLFKILRIKAFCVTLIKLLNYFPPFERQKPNRTNRKKRVLTDWEKELLQFCSIG